MINRNTIQCSMVLEAVNKLKCHATAVEVYDEVVRVCPHISRATVYRNLNRLSQIGKIRKIEIPGAADRFDHRCKEHYHILCETCGRVLMWTWMSSRIYTKKSGIPMGLNLQAAILCSGESARNVNNDP